VRPKMASRDSEKSKGEWEMKTGMKELEIMNET
jgi:hypothetical protein